MLLFKKNASCLNFKVLSSFIFWFGGVIVFVQLILGLHFLPEWVSTYGESVPVTSTQSTEHDAHVRIPQVLKSDHSKPLTHSEKTPPTATSSRPVLLRDLPRYRFKSDKYLESRKRGLDYRNLETLDVSEIPYFSEMLNKTVPNWGSLEKWDKRHDYRGIDVEARRRPVIFRNKKVARHGNPHCSFAGKVVNVGLMKTGTTSMVAALSALGYRCAADSCIHIGHWAHLNDAELLHSPLPEIVDSVLAVPEYYRFYRATWTMASTFGDSAWNFLFAVFDEWFEKEAGNAAFMALFAPQFADAKEAGVGAHANVNATTLRRRRGLSAHSKYVLMVRSSNAEYVKSYVRYVKGLGKTYTHHGLTMDEFGYLVLRRYELFNSFVIDWFRLRGRLDDLLVVDLKELGKLADPWLPLKQFLGCEESWSPAKSFPHQNKSPQRAGKKKARPGAALSAEFDYDWRAFFRGMVPRVDHDPADDTKTLKRLRIWLNSN